MMAVYDKKVERIKKKQKIWEGKESKRVDWSVNRVSKDASADHSNIYL
jgi:hypothetical protein